jgi:chemotaxis protein MotB
VASAAPSTENAASEPLQPIIIKKITVEGGGGHHGGAWKVAYADFVTAMMAFFLLMWLLGATTEDQRKGLADFFTPTLVKIKEKSAGGDGFMNGSSLTDVDNYPNRQGQTGNKSLTIPRSAVGGPVEGNGTGKSQDKTRAELKEKLEEEIKEKLEQKSKIRHLAKQVRVQAVPQGVRIDLVDDAKFSMFALGTTVLVPEARELLDIVAETLADKPSMLAVRGHTDSLPWRDGVEANNWSLSAGRAEATRQALMGDALSADRFSRIEGVAEREPLIPDDPADPRNRRISILLQ